MKYVVLGASGAVGQACARTLLRRPDAHVVATGRDVARLRRTLWTDGETRQPDVVRMDLDEEGSADAVLTETEQVDVVINCAGPSYRYSARIAELAVCRGAAYVDAGGDQAVIEAVAEPARKAGRLAVFGAGVQPGLAGVAVRAIASHLGDPATTRIDAHCGGLQPLTKAGLDEYLHAVRARTGHPGKVYERGELRSPNAGSPNAEMTVPPAFPATASAHVSLDEECRAAADELGLAALRWCNITDSPQVEQALTRALGQERSHAETLRAIDAALAGAQPYFRISLTGESKHSRVRTVLHCADSSALTGALAALAALEFPLDSTGAAWMSQCIDAARFWARVADVTGVSLSTWDDEAGTDSIEDGEL